jgi:hypothetical protein
MPAKDRYHDTVKRALIKDGWVITDDPFTVLLPQRFVFIDLRAAKKDTRLAILVEIKGFEIASQIEALAAAIGKYNLYQSALKITRVSDPLYLAVPLAAFRGIISEALGQQLVRVHNVHILVFDPNEEKIIQWIP